MSSTYGEYRVYRRDGENGAWREHHVGVRLSTAEAKCRDATAKADAKITTHDGTVIATWRYERGRMIKERSNA